jgi:hypothetical protein
LLRLISTFTITTRFAASPVGRITFACAELRLAVSQAARSPISARE